MNFINMLIKDNGHGIPSGCLKQIFEPFYTTKDEVGGVGFYVTKQFVAENNGCIPVKLKVRQRTLFSLEFKR